MPAASIAGSIIGNSEASGSNNAAGQDYQQALENYQNAQIPTTQEQQWDLANEQSAGTLNPETEGAVQVGSNAMDNISTNPAYAQAQMSALQQLQQLGQGGLTAQERQNLIQSQQAAAGTANSANAALQQQMAARGMGGSGLQLATALSSNQNAANQAASNGNAINAQAQQNALGAMSQSGNLAGSMQAQQFGQQAAQAQAQNAINQFNAQNQQNVNAYNTQEGNAAQAANLANAQNIANTNTSLANQSQEHNTGLYQQQFNDQMQQANGENSALNNQAGFNQQQAANTAAEWAGIGNGVNSMATSAFSAMAGVPGGFGGGSGTGSQVNTSPDSSSYGNMNYSGGQGNGYQASSNDWGNFAGAPGSYKGGQIGYAHGGKIEHVDGIQAMFGEIPPPNTFAEGGMINPPDYSIGGMIAKLAPMAAMAAMSKGGEVSKHDQKNLDTLHKAFSKFLNEEAKEKYAQGGEVSTLGMNSYYEGGNLTGLPHAPQKKMDSTDMNQSYSGGGDVIGLSGHPGKIPLPAKPHFDNGGNVPQYMQNMAALQRGANALAIPQKPKANNFDPSKYAKPDFSNTEDAVEAAEEQTALEHPNGMAMPDDVQAAMNKYQTYARGGQVPARVSPGEIYYNPKEADAVAKKEVEPKQAGEVFPGKAPVKGDSPKNDIINTKLEAGGIVIPRSVAKKSDDDILNFVKKVREGKKK